VSLSTSRVQRFRRILQLVAGVLLGIAVGELLSAAIATSTVALGAIVFVTLAIAVGGGAGFFAGGMMFANQAAASAILVVTLHRHGTGAERAIDALVGGGVALVLGVGLFPAHPLKLLHDAESALLAQLATTVEQAVEMLYRSIDPGAEWALARGAEVHERLSDLAGARATAGANVRIAPRRWHLRPVVEAEIDRLSRFGALAEAVLGTARAATRPIEGSEPLPATLRDELASLGVAMRRLARTRQPWPQAALEDVQESAGRIVARATSEPADRGAVAGSLLHTSALDLIAVTSYERPIPKLGDTRAVQPDAR
ncbi:MAG TPA: FUSC family protein, partial [Solirubrobacteraceae bacterium]|nr:FUSC family protein [Solirubrobacteraceae bacterium]